MLQGLQILVPRGITYGVLGCVGVVWQPKDPLIQEKRKLLIHFSPMFSYVTKSGALLIVKMVMAYAGGI